METEGVSCVIQLATQVSPEERAEMERKIEVLKRHLYQILIGRILRPTDLASADGIKIIWEQMSPFEGSCFQAVVTIYLGEQFSCSPLFQQNERGDASIGALTLACAYALPANTLTQLRVICGKGAFRTFYC